MIKTGTITFHAPDNCGAFFQAYALQQVLTNRLHVSNQIIDYRSAALAEKYGLLSNMKGMRGVGRSFLALAFWLPLEKRKRLFEQCRKQYLNMTFRCESRSTVIEQAQSFDVMICGSDQIWNCDLKDYSDIYFLPGVKKKISYAASLGKSLSQEKEKCLIEYLPCFSAVSFREPEGAAFARGIIGEEQMAVTLDPTLLLEKEDYLKLFTKKGSKDKYIFLYTVIMSESILQTAEHLSKNLSMPVIMMLTGNSIHSAWRAKKHGISVQIVAGPKEFLSLIENASLVITNSFHGTAFSIIFNKQFYCVREIQNGAMVPEHRLDGLLNMFGLSSRNVTVESSKGLKDDASIDWGDRNDLLRRERKKCIEWLGNMINFAASRETVPVSDDKSHCCGCGACSVSCPQKAITMVADDEGFYYPYVFKDKCVSCGICKSVCAFNADQQKSGFKG